MRLNAFCARAVAAVRDHKVRGGAYDVLDERMFSESAARLVGFRVGEHGKLRQQLRWRAIQTECRYVAKNLSHGASDYKFVWPRIENRLRERLQARRLQDMGKRRESIRGITRKV